MPMPPQPPNDRLLPGSYEPPLRPVEPGESAGVVSFRQAIAVVRRRLQLIVAITAVGAAASPAAAAGNVATADVVRLKLRHTWTTTMSSSEYRDNLYVRIASGGITGVGEGAPIVRYNESAVEGTKVIESMKPLLSSAGPSGSRNLRPIGRNAGAGVFHAEAARHVTSTYAVSSPLLL